MQGYGAWTGGGVVGYQVEDVLAGCCCGRGGGGRVGCPNVAGGCCVDCCARRKVVDRGCGVGDPHRGSEWRPWEWWTSVVFWSASAGVCHRLEP